MKKFLLILIFFDYLISFGQDFSLSIDTNTKEKNKYFLLSKKFILTAWRDDRDCGSLFYVQLNDKDVPIKIGNKTFTRFEGFGSGTYYPEIKYPFDFEPKKVFIHGWFKDSGNFRSCDTRWGANNARFDVKNEKPIDICKTGEVKGRDATQGEVSIASTLEFYIIPLHTLKTSDNNSAKFLPIDVKVPLIAKEGFDSDLYRYEYATQGNNWRPLPAKFQKKQRIDVSAEDVLESKTKAEEMIGKHIYFRVVSYDKDTGLVCSSSNNVDLTVTQAAPLITIKNIQSPLCNSNETTATVTIQLSRKLLGSLEQYKKNRGAYLGEVFNTFSFIKEGGNQTEAAIGINGLPKDLTEYFLQHDRIDNVVLTTASVTTNYQIDIKGKFYYLDSNGQRKDIQLYTDDTQHKGRFTVAVPEPLNSSLYYKYDNQCFGESMGVIILGFSGGTPPYKYIKNGEEPIPVYGNSIYLSSLPSGTYTFTITDKNDCQILKNGVVSPVVVTITQPQIPITITNEIDYISQIRGYRRKDGAIRPIIKGGTTVNGEYLVQLQTQTQTLTFSGTGRRPSGGYQASFDNLDKGTYTLTIQDHKGCILTRVISIVEPPLLTASISATTTIGCNQNNNDPNNHYELYNNGVLSATVEGGVPPYKYRWKKIGSQTSFLGNGTAVIRRLGKGTYQLVVTDENDNEATAFYTLTEPPRLMLSVTKSEMTCSAPNGGQATAIASGGTPPYTYLWNTGHSGAHITGLSAGKYFVTVSDSRGCSVQEKVVLSYPEEVEVNNAIITPVTCYEGNDGKIALTLLGGKGNINVSWYDAQGNLLSQRITNGGKTINGLKAGKYKAVFRDQSDCPALEQFYEVLQPEKTVINIPSQITICQGDSRSFDLSTAFPSATFRWTDSTGTLLSTEPTFAVSAKGIYKVEITDQKGCREATTFEVLQGDKVLEVDFLAATNAYYNYTVKLINLSHSITTQWVLPQEVTLIKEENGGAEVRFPKEGTYTIGLKGFLDGCEKTIYKTLWVEKDRLGIGKENSFKEVVIDDFKIVDNPNNGIFRIEVKLKKPAAIKIYGMDILGQMVISPIEQPESTTFNIPVSNSRLSGQYLIILEAGGDVMVQKMIVNH